MRKRLVVHEAFHRRIGIGLRAGLDARLFQIVRHAEQQAHGAPRALARIMARSAGWLWIWRASSWRAPRGAGEQTLELAQLIAFQRRVGHHDGTQKDHQFGLAVDALVLAEHRADIEGRMADLKATLEEIRAYEVEARGLLKKQGG